MGGKGINAHTWHEETVYKVDLPANRLVHWAKIESERFANPVFRLFHTELETVYEEKNRSIDNKDRLLNTEVVNELLFKVHPYGQQPTLGTIEHLKNPSIKADRRILQHALCAGKYGYLHFRRYRSGRNHQGYRRTLFLLEGRSPSESRTEMGRKASFG